MAKIPSTTPRQIQLRGVREAGLDGIDVNIPLRRLVGLSGAAGAGAQALAQRVLLGESRRRYLLSLTPFERERIGGIGKQAKVDGIEGLPPAQPLPAPPGDSTVASGLHLRGDLVRVVRRCAQMLCAECGGACAAFHEQDIWQLAQQLFATESLLVVAPMVLEVSALAGVLGELEQAGFRRLRIGQQVVRLDAIEKGMDLLTDGALQVVVDRLSLSGRTQSRMGEAVRTARAIGAGRTLLVADSDVAWVDSRLACIDCGARMAEPDWNVVVHGECSDSVCINDVSAAAFLSELRLGQLRELTQAVEPTGPDREGSRLRRAAIICEELQLCHLPLWRRLVDLSHAEQLLIGIAAARITGLTGILHVVLSPPSAVDDDSRLLVWSGLRSLVDEGASVVILDSDPGVANHVDVVLQIGSPTPMDSSLQGKGMTPAGREAEQLVIEAPGKDEVPTPEHRIVIPLGRLVAITGPKGSGKTQLLRLIRRAGSTGAGRVRAPAVRRVVDAAEAKKGMLLADRLGVHRALARVFADGVVARDLNFGVDHFLLEKPGGRCSNCEGQGLVRHELDFVEDIEVPCARCGGQRFGEEVLSSTAHGVTIAEAYAMTVFEARMHFGRERKVRDILHAAEQGGLGARRLDTLLQNLDDVERVLVSLARHQTTIHTGDLILFDRPLAGCDDSARVSVTNGLHRLVAAGASVIVTDATASLDADATVELSGS
jgi:excinuclease ABC subunit A